MFVQVYSLDRYNGLGYAPFLDYSLKEPLVFTLEEDSAGYLPRHYVYSGRLFELVTGKGSTYYIPSRILALPFLEDGPFVINNWPHSSALGVADS